MSPGDQSAELESEAAPATDATPADILTRRGRASIGRTLNAVVLAALLLPFVIGAARALADDSIAPSGDVALIEVRTRDVGSQTPLLGSYQRFGFNQPGPLLFYLLAVPYRLFGARFAGLEVGTLALGALSVAAIAWVCHRRGGTVLLLWVGMLVAVLVHGVGPAWVANPWEPHGLLLPCAALVLLVFDAAAGRAWTLPLVAATASLLAQAYATLLPFAWLLGFAAAAGVVASAVCRPRERPIARRAVVATVVLTAVLWTPTAVEQLTGEPGNLTAMARELDQSGSTLGLVDGARLIAIQLGHRGPWMGWPTPLEDLSPIVDPSAAPVVPIGAVALAGACLVALRLRLTAGWLAAAAAAAALAGAVGLSRLLGPPFVWIPQWTRALGFVCWAAVGWVAVAAAPASLRDRFRAPITGVLLVATIGLSLLNATEAATAERLDEPLAGAVKALVDDAGATIAALDEPVLISSTAAPSIVFGSHSEGLESLVLALERDGVKTVVDARLANRFGPERARPERARSELRLALEGDPVPAGARLVATADPLSAGERTERTRLLESIGLGAEASIADIVGSVARDPSVRPVADRLTRFSDLPPFVLLLVPAT